MTSTLTLTQTYNVQTLLWAVGRVLAQMVVIVALLLAALWVACLVGIVAYAYITYPKGPVRR